MLWVGEAGDVTVMVLIEFQMRRQNPRKESFCFSLLPLSFHVIFPDYFSQELFKRRYSAPTLCKILT